MGFSPFFSIAVTNIAFFLLLLTWVADLVRKKTVIQPHRTSFDFVLLTYFLVWVISALAGLSPLDSFKRIVVFQHPLVFYMLLFAYGGDLIPTALLGMGAGAGLNVLYGWGQLILWKWVYDYNGGIRPEWLMVVPEHWRSYLTLSPGQGRIHGAFHLLTYSELLLVPFFYLGARALEKGKALVFTLGFLLAGSALIFTAERGPFFGALFGITLMAVVHPNRRRLILPVTALMLMLWFNPVFKNRLMGVPTATGETPAVHSDGVPPVSSAPIVLPGAGERKRFLSEKVELIKSNHRVCLWKGGLYIASRHWVLGVGPGQIGPATSRYKKFPDFPPNPEGQEKDLHSFYIQRLAEMGVPGLLVSLWVILVFYRSGRDFFQHREKISARFKRLEPETLSALSLGVWALFLAYGIINLTERAYDDAEVAIVFWILAAASVWFTRMARGSDGTVREGGR